MRFVLRSLVKPWVLRWVHRRNERLRRQLEAEGLAVHPGLWDAQVSDAGRLSWGGCELFDLAERFGTPLQVVHEDLLAANFRRFQSAFRECAANVEVGFSYKTNPLPGALAILHRAGAWAEVISHFELWLALQLGVPAERIVFNGPGKGVDGLKQAVAQGVRIINIDHAEEADTIQRLACAAGRRQAVGVRVITSVGWAAQFGIPLQSGAAKEAFARIQRHDALEPIGLHIHLGTGIRDVGIYQQAVAELFDFAEQLRDMGIRIRFFDLGGGFGVPTVAPISAMDERLLAAGYPARPLHLGATPALAIYARTIGRLVERHASVTEGATIFFEPGRALSSSTQMLLVRVLAVKPGPHGSRNAILDGGHNLALPTGYELHQVLATRGLHERAATPHHLFGPLCHPGDVLARGCMLPPLEVGDVVALADAGAYFIPNQMNFSNPRAPAVIVRDGVARPTRVRESFEHMVALDLEPCTRQRDG